MKKQWKHYNDNCPNCGEDLEVFSAIPKEQETDDIQVYDGENVRCAAKCGFESCIDVSEDGNATVQDGNIDELENNQTPN